MEDKFVLAGGMCYNEPPNKNWVLLTIVVVIGMIFILSFPK